MRHGHPLMYRNMSHGPRGRLIFFRGPGVSDGDFVRARNAITRDRRNRRRYQWWKYRPGGRSIDVNSIIRHRDSRSRLIPNLSGSSGRTQSTASVASQRFAAAEALANRRRATLGQRSIRSG